MEAKGGEALSEAVLSVVVPSWRVLWMHSNSEQLVYDQLAKKGIELFLPTVEAWSRRGGIRRLSRLPVFRGYIFWPHAVDQTSDLEVCPARRHYRRPGQV